MATPWQNRDAARLSVGLLPLFVLGLAFIRDQFTWVDREHDLIVVQSPGTFYGSLSPATGVEAAERVLTALE